MSISPFVYKEGKMNIKVKILDLDLMRRYGSSIIEMNYGVAKELQEQGKVEIVDEIKKVNKEKNAGYVNEKESLRFPDNDDPIFPQIKIKK